MSDEFIREASFYNTIEIIFSNLFNVIVASSVLIKFLKPLNPIIIADNVAYNNKLKKFKFCYWIMLPEGKFLFDVSIRIFLTTREAHQEGVNALRVIWQSEDESVINLKQARGIRYAQLSENESEMLYKHSKEGRNVALSKKYELNFTLSGSDASGTTYYAWKRYEPREMWYGYQFVPLQQHEYTNNKFFTGDEDQINVDENDFVKELFRYQHFGKLFELKNAERHYEENKKNIVLTKDQIIKGQYKGLKQKLLDFCSWIIMLFLDRSHWKSWWKKRGGKHEL